MIVEYIGKNPFLKNHLFHADFFGKTGSFESLIKRFEKMVLSKSHFDETLAVLKICNPKNKKDSWGATLPEVVLHSFDDPAEIMFFHDKLSILDNDSILYILQDDVRKHTGVFLENEEIIPYIFSESLSVELIMRSFFHEFLKNYFLSNDKMVAIMDMKNGLTEKTFYLEGAYNTNGEKLPLIIEKIESNISIDEAFDFTKQKYNIRFN